MTSSKHKFPKKKKKTGDQVKKKKKPMGIK